MKLLFIIKKLSNNTSITIKTMKNHFINIPFNKSTAKSTIYNNFDYEFDTKLFDQLNNNDIPIIYNNLHKYILSLSKNARPITFSADYSISAATCSAMGEKYMMNEFKDGVQKYTTNLKVIYLTPSSHLSQLNYSSQQSFTNSILSDMLGLNETSYTNNHFIIPSENFTLIGLNEFVLQPNEIENLNNNNVKYFTLSQIKKKTIENICEYIQELVNNDPVFIIFDMSVMSTVYAPGVIRFIDNDKNLEKQLDGLYENEIISLFKLFGQEMNIVGMDITGFNIHKDTAKNILNATINTANLALMYVLNIKEKRINVFTEDTRFLIFRPIERINEQDFGWYILKGIPLEIEEKIINKLDLSTDNIDIFSLDDDTEVYIAVTTIAEQNNKSFEETETIFDCVLVPEEKDKILFYLVTKQTVE